MMESFSIYLKSWLPENYGVIVQVFAIVLVALIVNFIARRFIKRLIQRLQRTNRQWDAALAKALSRPATGFIWVAGLFLAINLIKSEQPNALFDLIGTLKNIAVVSLVGWFLIRLAKNIEVIYIQKQQYDITTIQAISKLVRSAVFITIGLLLLQALGYSIQGLLAFGGIGGIALGFAAKDVLANLFGGIVIYFERPFSVGDWIRSPDKEIEGKVEHIGWRSTKIRTFDKRPLYVPNSSFNQISIQNPSRMTNRRIKETIGLRYEDAGKVRDIVDAVRSMLANHPEIDTNQTLIVSLNTFAPSSLDFFIYTFTKTINWVRYHEVKQDILISVMSIIADHGAEIAFPTSTLHLEKLPEPEIRTDLLLNDGLQEG